MKGKESFFFFSSLETEKAGMKTNVIYWNFWKNFLPAETLLILKQHFLCYIPVRGKLIYLTEENIETSTFSNLIILSWANCIKRR